jgi:hypothetical protein
MQWIYLGDLLWAIFIVAHNKGKYEIYAKETECIEFMSSQYVVLDNVCGTL